jgi:hypothetical protein
MDRIKTFLGKHNIRHTVLMTAAVCLLLFAGSAADVREIGAQGVEKQPPAIAEKKDTPEPVSSAESWPRVIEGKTITLIAHQPQLDKWDFNIIECRMAVEIVPKDKKDPYYGGIWLQANTDISGDDRLVRLRDIKV